MKNNKTKKQKEYTLQQVSLMFRKLDTLKVRSLSYLTYHWDYKMPLMIRQHYIEQIMKAKNIDECLVQIEKAGLDKRQIKIMVGNLQYLKEA